MLQYNKYFSDFLKCLLCNIDHDCYPKSLKKIEKVRTYLLKDLFELLFKPFISQFFSDFQTRRKQNIKYFNEKLVEF